jgi:hypothetical protein
MGGTLEVASRMENVTAVMEVSLSHQTSDTCTWLSLVVALVVAVHQRNGLAETDRHGTSLEHFYVRESVCARMR